MNQHGERGWIRTSDPRLKRALLYQLSYAPTLYEFNIFEVRDTGSRGTTTWESSRVYHWPWRSMNSRGPVLFSGTPPSARKVNSSWTSSNRRSESVAAEISFISREIR